MNKSRKTVNSNELDKRVDEEQSRIAENEQNSDFDDPHLIAILNITGCKLIVTKDRRFINPKDNYIKRHSTKTGEDVPRVYYQRRDNKGNPIGDPPTELLSDKYIADCCKPKQS